MDKITKLELESLFNGKNKYIVPLYQRAYSWTKKEIEQLIDDICDYDDNNKNNNYYIGSLIVFKRKDKYEVIDGQQRLTTLFILYKYLKMNTCDDSLTFECRDKSNYTLRLNDFDSDDIDYNLIEENILKGYKCIKEKFRKGENESKCTYKEKFIENLKRIILYMIEVPEYTDLNRYFEIMNTRGEQLEQHDILKANLMKVLNSEKEREAFSIIWTACSDMTGYVQMHFPRKYRDKVFGQNWKVLESQNNTFEFLVKNIDKRKNNKNLNIKKILNNEEYIDESEDYYIGKERVRFASFIEFPFFLEHVLKVYIRVNKINVKVKKLLDDKKLLDYFEDVLKNVPDRRDFSIGFINCLIKCRFLFDKYIIKREFHIDDDEGQWSIKSIDTSGQMSNKTAYFKETEFYNLYQKKPSISERTYDNLMIQSCLRVSYTSPKIMHWVTFLLEDLYNRDESKTGDFSSFTEKYAMTVVKHYMPEYNIFGDYKLGVDTPHIILNYIDYLLWKENKKISFVFEYRDSVEHWYPQHPSKDSFEEWDMVDTLGNLCLVQGNINSKFSNMSPMSKKNTFKEAIRKGSLKLREMSELTTSDEGWKNVKCKEHEERIVKLLNDGIKSTDIINDDFYFDY